MQIASTRIIYRLNEYQVKAYGFNGERIPNADYFTNDRDDAKATARAMVNPDLLRQPGYNPREVT